jgi:hypothetical protein
MAHEFGDERQAFIRRCFHSDAPAPPDIRARAAALERALPHVNHSVAHAGWFAGPRGFVTPSAVTVLAAQPLAHDDDEVQVMLRRFDEEPLSPLSVAFAVELFRRHRHAMDLVMSHESTRQYNNLCSLMFALIVDSVDRPNRPFHGLDDTWDPTPS